MNLLLRILGTAFALLAVAYFLPGIEVDSVYIAIVTAIILGVLNVLVKPILIILTLPINIVTFGLFTLVINATIFWFASSFIDGFYVASFFYAFVGSLLVSLVSSVLNKLVD